MLEVKNLTELKTALEKAYQTLPLVEKVTDIVHGEGNEQAEILLIGEAPGYYESLERRPFVGRSGQLLRQTLQTVGLKAEQLYISNIVKVRPPDNRDPLPNELAAFKPFLDKEIELIQPQLVITLGRFSMGKFLPNVKVSQVHGRLHKITWQGQQLFILPMYHPAAALRSTQLKNSFLADFQKVPKIMTWIKKHQKTAIFTQQLKEALF